MAAEAGRKRPGDGPRPSSRSAGARGVRSTNRVPRPMARGPSPFSQRQLPMKWSRRESNSHLRGADATSSLWTTAPQVSRLSARGRSRTGLGRLVTAVPRRWATRASSEWTRTDSNRRRRHAMPVLSRLNYGPVKVLPKSAAPWNRTTISRASAGCLDHVGQSGVERSLRTGIEPVSTGRQPVCDASRITEHGGAAGRRACGEDCGEGGRRDSNPLAWVHSP